MGKLKTTSRLAVSKTIQKVRTTGRLLFKGTNAAKQTDKTIPVTRISRSTKQFPKRVVAVAIKPVKRATRTKVYKATKRVTKATHRVIAKQPHEKLMARFPHYNKWHSWQYKRLNHNHIHVTATVSGIVAMVVVLSNSLGSVYALSTWTQADWSGGVGTSITNQYASKSNMDASSGSLKVTGTSAITNGGFETNLDGWKMTGPIAGTFASKIDYATGTSPCGIGTGDLDGDKNVDVITVNCGSNSVSILKNQGNGTFATKVDYATGTAPQGVAVGDLDGDGDLDLSVTNYTANTVSILKNQGNGTFATKVDYATGGGPQAIIPLADVDGDGDLDLVITNYSSNTVSILKNQGNGTFSSKVDYAVGSYPAGATLADFDGDGDLDMAVVNNNSGTISVFFNNGLGIFASRVDYSVGQYAHGITSGDLDNDGDNDIVATNDRADSNPSVAFTLLNNGNGTFAPKVSYSVGSNPIRANLSDIDLDGDLDMVVMNYSVNTISVLKNNGNGTFATKTDFSTGTRPFGVSSADINNDTYPDLVTANQNANTISTFLNYGNPYTYSTEQTFNSTHSTKIVSTSGNSTFYQTATVPAIVHTFTAYAYTSGSAVTAADAQLYAGGNLLTTTYTATSSPGWYKLTANVTGTGTPQKYGVQIPAGKTVYLDDISIDIYTTGTLISAIQDTNYGSLWGKLNYNTTSASTGTTEVRVRSSNDPNMVGAPAFAGCPVLTSGSELTPTTCVTDNERYIQYQVTLIGQDGQTPTLSDISIDYSPFDNIPPSTNATNIVMKRAAGGSTMAANSWTNGPNPYFDWTAGADNPGGTGVKGYCLYLGTDSSADPTTTKGLLGSSPVNSDSTCPFVIATNYIDTATAGYLATSLSSSNTNYYLNIKLIDNANNVYTGANTQFNFKYDNTPPTNSGYVTAPSQFVANKAVTLTWPISGGDAAGDANSGLAGLQYRIGSSGTWYGDGHSGSQDKSDVLANDGSYTTQDPPDFDNINEGNNVIYFRSWDNAGNVSATNVTTVIKLNTTSPSGPQNVTASPSANTTNNFSFSWAAPNSFQGPASNLTYCYTINTLPTSNTCSYTAVGATSLPNGAYATQPGINTFYVVAKDEAGNINFATAASDTFTANTSAPGVPLEVDVADVSTKATSTWRLALSWNEPTSVGAGVSSYRIYRSTDDISYTQVASSAGTSYVDGGLAQQKYYYKIKACDSANNCGAYSSTVNKLPTGKFTSAATITAQPLVSGISTKKATIRWSTNRTSNSRISLGTKSGEYAPFQVASDEQVTDHVVDLTNLSAGTTYFAKASWTDEDGNNALSSEFIFKTENAPATQEVKVLSIGLSTAQIQFTSITAAKVVIQYGTTDNFGGVKEIATSLARSTYTLDLVGLNDGTKYLYRLNTFDADGNEYIGSTVLSFTTPARPKISNLRFQPIEGEPTSTQQVSWQTNVPASSQIIYGKVGLIGKEIADSSLKIEHEITINGLEDNSDYTLVAQSRDQGGNLATSDSQKFKTALDTRPPKISDITVESTIKGNGAQARGQIVIAWKTDEPSTSQVAYVEGSDASVFNNKSTVDDTLTTDHLVIVSDLPTSKLYSLQPISNDNATNKSFGVTQSAIVGKASDSVLTIILTTLKGIFGF